MPRMQILNTLERTTFETPPVFGNVQRKQHFDFPLGIQRTAAALRTPVNQVAFLLASGYFTASKRFFPVRTFHPRDVAYVAEHAGLAPHLIDLTQYDQQSEARHRTMILDFYGVRPFDAASRAVVGEEIARLVQAQLKPKGIFWRGVDVLVREKVEVPGYFRLAALILRAINRRHWTLVATCEHLLTPALQVLLDPLLTQQPAEASSPPGKTTVYKLTLLKKLSQSTRPSKVKARVQDRDLLAGLYAQLQPLLGALALGPEGIRYYAHSVLKADVFQLTRRRAGHRYLHLIAFIAHQFYRLQDNLVDVLLTSLQSFHNGTLREHKEQCYLRREQHAQALQQLVGAFAAGLGTLTTIEAIADNGALSDTEKVTQIRKLLAARAAQRRLETHTLATLKAAADTEIRGEAYYEILEARSLKVQQRVSPILKVLHFDGERGTEALLTALTHFQAQDGAIEKNAPLAFLDPAEQDAVTIDGTFRVSLYKAFLFLHVQGAIRSGSLNLAHSYKYQPLGAYLIDRERWERDKAQLLARAELEGFADPHAVLEELDDALARQYETTNRHIADGTNTHLTFRKSGEYSISTPTQEESEAETLPPFFPEQRIVPLREVLATVNRYSHYLDELQHWQQRYHHGRPSDAAIFAGIIGLGCSIGVRKMARISHPISEAELERVVHWYFSVDALHAANDRVLQVLDRLELPNRSRRHPERLHTVSDGQKFEVRVDSLNANYSYKYFGKGQGVSVYTFRDERDLLWYSTVFSSAERECAYVIDGLMHNDVVKSDIHSTDAFGFSELVFGVSHQLGFSYAPRFKQLARQRLYIFASRRGMDRSAWKIRPTAYSDTALILQQWDEILRLITTIKLKEVTASDLFRRLNSYSKQHTLYQALKAFGQIPKSLFILRYLDDPVLRQAIEQQLARIEHVHRFTRAVSVGNPREFLQAEKHEQELAEACKRLVKNCIICWNYLYLSQQLADTEDETSRAAFLDAVAHGSVVAWQHINLLGEYDFSEDKLQDTVGIRPPILTA